MELFSLFLTVLAICVAGVASDGSSYTTDRTTQTQTKTSYRTVVVSQIRPSSLSTTSSCSTAPPSTSTYPPTTSSTSTLSSFVLSTSSLPVFYNATNSSSCIYSTTTAAVSQALSLPTTSGWANLTVTPPGTAPSSTAVVPPKNAAAPASSAQNGLLVGAMVAVLWGIMTLGT